MPSNISLRCCFLCVVLCNALGLDLIALAIVLLLGGKKIPELMKGLGGGIKEFKKASREDDDSQKEIEEK